MSNSERIAEPMTLDECKVIIEKGEYAQISDDWRHRDNLTWQIPSVIVVIAGATLVAAFKLDIDPQYLLYAVRAGLLFLALSLSSCLTYALNQNIWYQVGSSLALESIIAQRNIPGKLRRALDPTKFIYHNRPIGNPSNYTKNEITTLVLNPYRGVRLGRAGDRDTRPSPCFSDHLPCADRHSCAP